ncbi:MAG TPA: hypothetical protein DC049_02020, partial [Spirochaetia bacterium]|nr:hypothetical protein [Spirochaetia bacterium]
MKKPVCTEENAIRFIYNLMNKAEQGEYQNHYASCTICSNFIHKIKTLKKITGRVKTPNLQAPVLREAISLPGASSFFHKFPVNLPALLVSIRADRNFSRAAVSVAA